MCPTPQRGLGWEHGAALSPISARRLCYRPCGEGTPSKPPGQQVARDSTLGPRTCNLGERRARSCGQGERVSLRGEGPPTWHSATIACQGSPRLPPRTGAGRPAMRGSSATREEWPCAGASRLVSPPRPVVPHTSRSSAGVRPSGPPCAVADTHTCVHMTHVALQDALPAETAQGHLMATTTAPAPRHLQQ